MIDATLYECTDDCIGAENEDHQLFQNILHTFSNATPKNIREVLHKYDDCCNIQLEDIYLLPREKRNHPKMCYEQGCKSSSVFVRKLAVHYKNCRKFMKLWINLNTAHQFIHDIDVATVLSDINYLIKLVALSPNKSPSVFSISNCPPIDIEKQKCDYDKHIAKYEKGCRDLPDIVCQSCDMLERETNIWCLKDKLKHKTNEAWKKFKDRLHIEKFDNKNIIVCNYCYRHYNSNHIPPRSKLNNMDPGEVPKKFQL